MKICFFAFTENGSKTKDRIIKALSREGDHTFSFSSKKEEVETAFLENDALIFVGACGIAVRFIAPFVRDKLTDPAVLVVDESGSFVIPLLSGHVGGANELAKLVGGAIGAVPVVTTATDINGVIAFDELAVKNGLEIVNRDNIKKVSGGLLRGEKVNLELSNDVLITSDESEIDDEVLGLLFRPVVVGLGMRKNKAFDELEVFFLETLEDLKVDLDRVAGIASIDVKAGEPALLELSEKYGIPLYFYDCETLNSVEGEFDESEFVRMTVGVSDVSARAAKALGRRGEFLLKKKKEDGMTISVFEKYRRITFEY